nr:hypothetical protein [uncultured Carboxylicivirga sp.]
MMKNLVDQFIDKVNEQMPEKGELSAMENERNIFVEKKTSKRVLRVILDLASYKVTLFSNGITATYQMLQA